MCDDVIRGVLSRAVTFVNVNTVRSARVGARELLLA